MQDKRHDEHPELFQKLSKALEDDEDRQNYLHLSYQVSFYPKVGTMLIRVFEGKKLITRFEHFGIHALGLHRLGSPISELDPDHRRFAQHLLRFAVLNPSEGYFSIPKKQVSFFLAHLSKFRDVGFFQGKRKVQFSDHPLTPMVELREENPTEVHLRASFQEEHSGKAYPYDQVRVFSGRRSWALCEDVFFPIKSSLVTPLLEDFNELGELTLRGAEAADFIQEYLPTLAKKPEVLLPEGFKPPEVRQEKPELAYEIEEDRVQDKLVLRMHFNYGGHVLPPHVDDKDVMVRVQNGEQPILIRRDMEFEKDTLQKYQDQGFHRVSQDRFETGGEAAMDFVTETLPILKKEAKVTGEDSLNQFRLFGELAQEQIRARATTSGMDWLEVDLGFEIQDVAISYDIIQALLSQGRRYLPVPGKGFVKINREDLLALEEKILEIEGEISEGGKLRVAPFQAVYLDESFAIDWSQKQELGAIVKSLRNIKGVPSRPLPQSLDAILREYQHHGFDWLHFLHDHNFHGILADDMGLGKTLQALAYLQDRKERFGATPNLVLAPTSVVFNWASETKKFTPNLKTVLLYGPHRKHLYKEIADADVVFTSYALFRRDAEILSKHHWHTVILDEAQNIKNYRSKTAQLVKKLKADQRWALTGTPLENRLSELWSIFDFLMPGFLGSYPHFKKKYQQPIENDHSSAHLDRLRRRIYPFILRRIKDEVAKELPPKTEVTHFCEMTHDQNKVYHEVLAACRKQVFQEVEKRGLDRSHVSILTALLRLRQICCHPDLLGPQFQKREIDSGKLEAFKDLLSEVISEGHRVLVFSQFVEMLNILKKWFEKESIAFEYLDGRTRRREEKIKNFNENKEIPVFLVSLRAGGTGLNLTGADYVIHYDPWWNPAVQDQATDRVHRIGQTKHVFSYKLITKDSVEEKILMLQEKKRGLVKGLLSSDSALGKKLSYEDLEYLFS